MTAKESLIEVVKKHGLKWAEPGKPFTLASGAKSDYYIDCKSALLTPLGAAMATAALYDEIVAANIPFDIIAGVDLGGRGLVSGLLCCAADQAAWIEKKGCVIRKEFKDHGLQNAIDGHLESGDFVVLVEDVVTSGGSVLKTIKTIHERGAEIALIVAVLDRLQGAADTFETLGYDFRSVLTIKDLGINPPNSN